MEKKVSFYTLGCRANQYDTEMMKEKVKKRHRVVPFEQGADVYIINTCTVTNGADSKSRKYIRKAARWGGFVIVTGCYPALNEEEVKNIDGVDMTATNRLKNNILDLIGKSNKGSRENISGSWNIDEQKISKDTKHTRAFVKIQDGCNKECSYCKVKYVRGPSRSKEEAYVLREIERISENGFREVVLTGIDLADYGKEGNDLANLLNKIADTTKLERLRLSSINPEGITPKLAETFEKRDELCPHFHIPLQSGSDKILKSMNREYTSSQYLEKVNFLKEKVTDSTFGTDVLVGFPGEKEGDVEATKEVIEKVGFLNYHLFPFSPREPTSGASMQGKVSHEKKKERKKTLRRVCRLVAEEEKRKFVGAKKEVLLEKKNPSSGKWRGYSKNYLDVQLLPSDEKDFEEGDFIEAEIEEAEENGCLARFLT